MLESIAKKFVEEYLLSIFNKHTEQWARFDSHVQLYEHWEIVNRLRSPGHIWICLMANKRLPLNQSVGENNSFHTCLVDLFYCVFIGRSERILYCKVYFTENNESQPQFLKK